jgi:large subunit ribosomal protein L17
MRHRRTSHILGRRTEQRIALLKNLTKSLLIYQRVKTTLAKAKAVRGEAERLITLAKENTLHHRRLVYNLLQDHQLTSELFKEIAPLFKTRNGGYTRIIRLNHRVGDNAQMVLLELVEQKVKKAIAPKVVKEKKKVEEKPKAEEKPKVKAEGKPKEEIKPKAEVKPEAEKPKKVEKVEKAKEEEPKKKEVPKEKPKGFLAGIKKLFKGKEK